MVAQSQVKDVTNNHTVKWKKTGSKAGWKQRLQEEGGLRCPVGKNMEGGLAPSSQRAVLGGKAVRSMHNGKDSRVNHLKPKLN
jgi:hypothetical protein